MMLLPSIDDLDKIARLMHGMDYTPLPANLKFAVVEIAQRGVQAYVLDQLATELSVGFAETVAGWNVGAIHKQLEEIDLSLGPIMDWFKHSKLWDGPQ